MNLDLGGKTPMIVFDDAALACTLPILAAAVTTFAGQNCMAASRILVQRGIADQLRERPSLIEVEDDERRLRRGRLQAKRSRPPARGPWSRGISGDQDIRPSRATRG
jgi:Aldehyde dehydrogenase family